VLIDIQIAFAGEVEVEGAVTRKELQHVIEETNAGGDFVLTATFNRQLDTDARLGRITLDNGGARGCWLYVLPGRH
jgi:hypothetical protein